MPGRVFNPGEYPFGYNGQRSTDEIAGVGNHYTAEFWEYDPRAVHRWNTDPEFRKYPGESPYAINHNSPIQYSDPNGDDPTVHTDENGNVIRNYNDGDNSVFVHQNGTTATDVDKKYVEMGHSAGGTRIGELGGEIDVNQIFDNVLKEHGNQTYGMGMGQWFLNVKKDGAWDLKNNKSTVFGVAWAFDESSEQKGKLKTNFLYTDFNKGSQIVNAADLGNYHAGYMGSMLNLGQTVQAVGAGVVETLKKGEFMSTLFLTNDFLKAPYGDAANDYKWNTRGMNDGQKNRGRTSMKESEFK